MTRGTVFALAFGLGVAALTVDTAAQTSTKPRPDRCIALPLPMLHGADGNSTEMAGSVRSLVSSFLAGPSLRAVDLDARLPQQAAEEAREQGCSTVLYVVLSRKKAKNSVLGRALGDAAGAAAWHMPYGGSSAASTAARSAAIAGTTAAASLASNVRSKDELRMEYRLESGDGKTLREGAEDAKASADGEDIVTPLVERMAGSVLAAVPR
jgi:hypothetical protein